MLEVQLWQTGPGIELSQFQPSCEVAWPEPEGY